MSRSRSAVLIPVLVTMFLGSSVLPGQSVTAAQDATPAAVACPVTTTEDNKEIVIQFLDAVHEADDVAVANMTEDGMTVHTHSKGERRGDAGGLFQAQRASFPDATMTIDLLVAEGGTVAAYVTWNGSLQGETAKVAGQDVEIPEDQRDAEWVGALFFHVECGKITGVRPVIDRLGHLMDLGVITNEDLQSADSIATPEP
jgi:predicted ester cyclase